MGLYDFKPRFVPLILAGSKTHTIRTHRAHPDKPGNTLHLYTRLRTKKAQLLRRVQCVAIQEIVIADLMPPVIFIDGEALNHSEEEAFANRDGFLSFQEMMEFWKGRLPFKGQIIHWRNR